MTFGRYLGPTTNVGSALAAKIIKQNQQYVCHSTLRHLMQEEKDCIFHITTQTHFDNINIQRIGPHSVPPISTPAIQLQIFLQYVLLGIPMYYYYPTVTILLRYRLNGKAFHL